MGNPNATCDAHCGSGVTACSGVVAYECGCDRCARNPDDNVHACIDHKDAAGAQHCRIFDRDPLWFRVVAKLKDSP